VVVISRSIATGQASGVDALVAHVWTIRGGRIVRFQTLAVTKKPSKPPGCGSRPAFSRDTARAMSQEIPPLETIRAGFDAFNRCDYESWVALYDEDTEFLDLAETPDTGVFRGHAGIRAWLAKLQEAWGEGFRFEPLSITQGDDVVVVDTLARGVGLGSDVKVEMTVYTVMRFRDQKIVWSSGFADRADALEAAGLSE
jgi:ketosteroid isomerase-like protein